MRAKCSNLERHQKSAICKRMTARKENERKAVLQMEVNKAQFFVNGKPIERVRRFKYLGHWLDEKDDDTFAIGENIKKARA